MSPSSLNITTPELSVVTESSGNTSSPLFSVSSAGVVIRQQLHVTSSLGLTLNGPLETSLLQSPANQDLEVQSLSGELSLTGGSGVLIEDGTGSEGGVSISAYSDISLTSQTGQVGGEQT